MPACATTCSCWRRSTPTPTTSRRALGFAWSPFDVAPHDRARQRRAVLRSRAAARAGQRAAVGRQHHRPRRACGRSSVSLSPTQAGAPVFPEILAGAGAVRDAASISRRWIANLQNAYSRQASVEVEQQLGEREHGERRLSVPARPEAADVGQPERADLRGGGHQQRLPSESRPTPTTASTRRSADSNYHGLHVSFMQRPARWGNYRVSATRCRSR